MHSYFSYIACSPRCPILCLPVILCQCAVFLIPHCHRFLSLISLKSSGNWVMVVIDWFSRSFIFVPLLVQPTYLKPNIFSNMCSTTLIPENILTGWGTPHEYGPALWRRWGVSVSLMSWYYTKANMDDANQVIGCFVQECSVLRIGRIGYSSSHWAEYAHESLPHFVTLLTLVQRVFYYQLPLFHWNASPTNPQTIDDCFLRKEQM